MSRPGTEQPAVGNPFVGPVETLAGMPNAGWGTLVVLFRNGEPDRLVLPGSKFGRGWRAPLTGRLQLVQINTGVETTDVTITNIPTADAEGWVIPSLDLRLQVQVNPAGRFAKLEEHVRTYGPGFPNALLDELGNGIDTYVKARLGQYSHRWLHTASMPEVLFPSGRPTPIGNESLVVRSAAVKGVVWSASFLQLTEGLQTVDNDATVKQYAVGRYRELALELGIPAWHLANPEQMQLDRAAALEILTKLLEPGNRGLLLKNESLLPALLAQTGVAGSAIAMPVPGISQTSLPPTERLTLQAGTSEARDTAGPRITPELSLNARLKRAWQSALGTDNGLRGIEGAAAGSRGAVVAVSDLNAVPRERSADLTQAIATTLRVQHVDVVALSGHDLDGLLTQWADQVVTHPDVAARLFTEDHCLVIELEGPVAQARSLAAQLDDVANPHVAALERLLAFEAITVRLAG